jgi:hypothetical protein
MRKFRKLTVAVAALAALAVGGAAFAQAQNAATAVQPPTQQSVGDEATPGDTPDAQVATDSGGKSDPRDSANEQSDGPDGPNDPADSAEQESQG